MCVVNTNLTASEWDLIYTGELTILSFFVMKQRTQQTMGKDCPAFCHELENAIKKKAGLYLQH
jgi:hypothetical protein